MGLIIGEWCRRIAPGGRRGAGMTDGEALLRAIIDEPDDDLHRLVYADWLEENGQTERAAYIRDAIVGMTGLWPKRQWPDSMTSLIDGGSGRVPEERHWGWTWHRGFVQRAVCPFEEWYRHGRAVCAAHPVVGLTLTDYEPYVYEADQHRRWAVYVSREESLLKYPGHQRYLPRSFAPHMDGEMRRNAFGHEERLYCTNREAVTAVCKAALSWAKERT